MMPVLLEQRVHHLFAEPWLERALAEYDRTPVKDKAALSKLSDRMWELSTRMMVAIRDPHPDDVAIAEIRDWFEATFGCCVTTNLYVPNMTKLSCIMLDGAVYSVCTLIY